MPGAFVVVEGPDGAGKSTLVAGLAARLRAAGVEPVLVREPGGTPAAEALRAELLAHGRAWPPLTELLYIATARADLLARVVRPALTEGRLVLSDRYDLSTRAYQGAGRGIPDATIGVFNEAATGGLAPDLTLVLDLPDGVGRARQLAAGKGGDRLDREAPGFHARVLAAYLAATGPGVHHLDGTRPPGEVLEEAWRLVAPLAPGIVSRAGEVG